MQRKLPVTLKREEVEMRARSLASTIKERQDLDEERAAAAANYKEQLKALDKHIGDLSEVVRTEQELRVVPCYEQRNDRLGTIEIIRDDTSQTIESRPMTAEERQTVLFPARGERVKAVDGE